MSESNKTKKIRIRTSTLIVLVITSFIVITTATMGSVLTVQSVRSMKRMVENKTIEMAATAASLLDAQSLKDMKATDVDTPEYQAAHDILNSFKISNEGTSGELAFIYLCKEVAPDSFIFTIDPSEDPAEWGEVLEWTRALDSASKGIPSFDQEPYTDRWGTFYSAYAPVLDEHNDVVMIVGIDVWASWYKESIWSNSRSIIIISAVATATGILLGVLITIRLRRKLNSLSNEFSNLENDVHNLLSEIKEPMENDIVNSQDTNGDVYTKDQLIQLRNQIQNTQKEIKEFIIYTKKQAYIDALSRIGNRAAYHERLKQITLDSQLAVIVFDINGLKYINDIYGHEYGDKAIIGAASICKSIFDVDNIYRIGGDEFVVVLTDKPKEEVLKLYDSFGQTAIAYNQKEALPFDLYISRGIAFFDRKVDRTYTDVFNRADEEMYKRKKEFHKNNPNFNKRH